MFARSCSLLLLLTLLAGCAKQPEPLASLQQFFEQVASGKMQEAYASTAFGFRAQQNEKAFARTMAELGIDQYVALQADKPEVRGREVKVEVEVATKSGTRVPFIITMLDEGGAWRVFALRSPRDERTGIAENRFSLVGRTAALGDVMSRPLPSDKEAKQLAQRTLSDFSDAVVAGSFTDFYDSVSRAWQNQLTRGQLQRAFQPFLDKKIDLSSVRDVEPIFDAAPVINTDGLLVLRGHVPTSPLQTIFHLKYAYELPKWKLFGIDVQLKR
jgi:hypothetical protein